MTVYRYRWTILDVAALAKQVPGVISPGNEAPMIFKDIDAPPSSKDDLDAFMLSQGWAFDSTSPLTTPAQQSAADSLARVSGYDEGSLLGKRAGINFSGAGVSAVDNPGSDRIDVTIAGGGGSFDMRDVLVWDHFMSGNVDTDEIGWMGWRNESAGTGAAISFDATPVSGHPGVLVLDAGTALAARACISLGETASPGGRLLIGTGANPIEIEFLIRWPSATDILAANLERVEIGLGLAWAADAELPDAVVMRFAPAAGDTGLRLVCAASGVRTVGAVQQVPVVGNWYRVGIVVTPGATPSATMSINGVAGSAISTNVPSTGLGVGLKSSGVGSGVAAFTEVDYFKTTQATNKET